MRLRLMPTGPTDQIVVTGDNYVKLTATDITVEQELSSGAFGSVFKGLCKCYMILLRLQGMVILQ